MISRMQCPIYTEDNKKTTTTTAKKKKIQKQKHTKTIHNISASHCTISFSPKNHLSYRTLLVGQTIPLLSLSLLYLFCCFFFNWVVMWVGGRVSKWHAVITKLSVLKIWLCVQTHRLPFSTTKCMLLNQQITTESHIVAVKQSSLVWPAFYSCVRVRLVSC